MKKLLALVLALAMVFTCVVASASPTVTMEDHSGNGGDDG